ncbi:MAG: DeoR/GlpR family DNA-binding transcription regulator [Floccifex sp.]
MKKAVRQIQIHDILLEKGRIPIKELAQILNVTSETIRSDITLLENQSLVIKEHGWVRLNQANNEKPLSFRMNENSQLKRKIAIRAFEEIKDGQVIFLDAGSTILAGVDALAAKKDITVVTHSLLTASRCVDLNIHTVLTGGDLNKESKRTTGYFSNFLIDHYHFDMAFTGSLGFKGIQGFTTVSSEGIDIIRHVINQSNQFYVVADSSKFDSEATYIYCRFKEVDCFVTDSINEAQREKIKDIKRIITL